MRLADPGEITGTVNLRMRDSSPLIAIFGQSKGLIRRLEAGSDIVCGWRKERQDPLVTRRIPSMVANWFISRVTAVRLHDYG